MNAYIETPADHAFSAFLAALTPGRVLRDRERKFSPAERKRQTFLRQKAHVEALARKAYEVVEYPTAPIPAGGFVQSPTGVLVPFVQAPRGAWPGKSAGALVDSARESVARIESIRSDMRTSGPDFDTSPERVKKAAT